MSANRWNEVAHACLQTLWFSLQMDTIVNNKKDIKCALNLGLDPKLANLPQSVTKENLYPVYRNHRTSVLFSPKE